MTDKDTFSLQNQDISHNLKMALLAVMQMRASQRNLDDAIRRMCTNQKKTVSFNAEKMYFRPANINRKMGFVERQIYIYNMMQKSEEFRLLYHSLPEHLK